MKRACVILLMIGLFLIPGCGPSEDYYRYPFVAIPGYEMKDYYALLSHRQSEIVYNAICNLIGDGASIGQKLSDKKADKNSQEYIISLKVYKKIVELLSYRDAKIQAAGLKFLERMSTQYGSNSELITQILSVRSGSPNVQYEQVYALDAIAARGYKIDPAVVRKFLQNRNWLVSRQAYSLVNRLEDEQLRMELIKKYGSTNAEFEKLLALGALKNNFSDSVFQFLTKEMTSSQNQKIRHVIFDMLGSAKDKQKVLEWSNMHFGAFSKEDVEYLAVTCSRALSGADVDFSCSLLIVLTNHGFKPKEDFYKELNSSIKELENKKDKAPEDVKKLESLARLDKALTENVSLKDAWLAAKNKVEETAQINKEMQKEFDEAVDQFALKTGEILKKYNTEEEARKKFVDDILTLKDYLVQQFGQ